MVYCFQSLFCSYVNKAGVDRRWGHISTLQWKINDLCSFEIVELEHNVK